MTSFYDRDKLLRQQQLFSDAHRGLKDRGLSQRAANLLVRRSSNTKLYDTDFLETASDQELLAIPGLGLKMVNEIRGVYPRREEKQPASNLIKRLQGLFS